METEKERERRVGREGKGEVTVLRKRIKMHCCEEIGSPFSMAVQS